MYKIYIFLILTLLLSSIVYGVSFSEWNISFQNAVSPIMENIVNVHNFILYIITGIFITVFGLIIYVLLRYNSSVHPVPKKFSNNVSIEIIWTIIPVIILIIIAIPSFQLLKKIEDIPDCDINIKVVGHQWYWNYTYLDYNNLSFDSYPISDENLKKTDVRLLSVDNNLVIPVGKSVRFLITAGDVIHSFSVPAFGIKTDAIPGRTNEAWVKVFKTGMYYGQCSELCGAYHGFMPIAVKVVTEEEFKLWIESANKIT